MDVAVNQSVRVDLVLKLGSASETSRGHGRSAAAANRIVFAGHESRPSGGFLNCR